MQESSYDHENELSSRTPIGRRMASAAIVIFVVFLLNVDTQTVPGTLKLIKDYFHVDNKRAGLLSTARICGEMVFSPVTGYIGDRFSRKWALAFGIMLWSSMGVLGSFMKENQFWIFFVTRGITGVGQAVVTPLVLPILSDLFVGDARARSITVYCLVIPIGMGCGGFLSAAVAQALHGWQWALRVTPPVALLCVIMCICLVQDPSRGASESDTIENTESSVLYKKSSYMEDLKYLISVKSYLFITISYGCNYFALASMSYWASTFLYYSVKTSGWHYTFTEVSAIIGIMMLVAGTFGIGFGALMVKKYRQFDQSADALFTAWCGFASAILVYVGAVLSTSQVGITWGTSCLLVFAFSCPVVPVTSVVLYTIVPTRRSTAFAVRNLMVHLFGDASSPFIIGAISDAIRGDDKSDQAQQQALLYAMYLLAFSLVLSAILALLSSIYLIEDCRRAEELTRGIKTLPDCCGSNGEHTSTAEGTASVGFVSDMEKEPLVHGRKSGSLYGGTSAQVT